MSTDSPSLTPAQQADFADIETVLDWDAVCETEGFSMDFDAYDTADIEFDWEVDQVGDAYVFTYTVKKTIPIESMHVIREKAANARRREEERRRHCKPV